MWLKKDERWMERKLESGLLELLKYRELTERRQVSRFEPEL